MIAKEFERQFILISNYSSKNIEKCTGVKIGLLLYIYKTYFVYIIT